MLVNKRQLRTTTNSYTISSRVPGSEISAKSPIKVLPNIIGEPAYNIINNFVQDLYVNMEMLLTTLGGGKYGHISLIMRPSLYAKLNQIFHTSPVDPGATPNILIGITSEEREQIWADYTFIPKIFVNHANMEIYMKILLVEVVDGCYLHKLRNRYTGYLIVTTMGLLDRLMYWYWKIAPIDIKDNKDQMQESIDTSYPIDIYFNCINYAVQFAANVNIPYTTQ